MYGLYTRQKKSDGANISTLFFKWGIHKDVNSWDKQSSRDQGSENSELKKPGNGWIDA